MLNIVSVKKNSVKANCFFQLFKCFLLLVLIILLVSNDNNLACSFYDALTTLSTHHSHKNLYVFHKDVCYGKQVNGKTDYYSLPCLHIHACAKNISKATQDSVPTQRILQYAYRRSRK